MVYICTEECPQEGELQFIMKELNLYIDNMKIFLEGTKIFYGRPNNKHEISIIQGTTSIVDYIVYETKECNEPILIVESTKNDPTQAGNMYYQRLSKFPIFDIIFPNNSAKKYIYFTFKDKKYKRNKPWEIATRMARTLGITPIISGKECDINCKEYSSLDEYIKHVNSTRRVKNNNRVYIIDNTVSIHTNIVKNNSISHDPNMGFSIAAMATISELTNMQVSIVHENLKQQMFSNMRSNKFLIACNNYGVKIQNANKELKLNESIIPNRYHKLAEGEKNVSIMFELIKKSWFDEVIFTNHAGCEKSYINIDSVNPFAFKIPKNVTKCDRGIPDICIRKNKSIYIIEAEISKNYNAGLNQLEEFNLFEDTIKKYYPEEQGYEYTRCVILYGEHKAESYFTLSCDYEVTNDKFILSC